MSVYLDLGVTEELESGGQIDVIYTWRPVRLNIYIVSAL